MTLVYEAKLGFMIQKTDINVQKIHLENSWLYSGFL